MTRGQSLLAIAATILTASMVTITPAVAGRYAFTDILLPDGTTAAGNAVNDKAEVVGSVVDDKANSRGFVWTPSKVTVAPDHIVDFFAVNNRQFAVGITGAAPRFHSVFYDLKNQMTYPVAAEPGKSVQVTSMNGENTAVGFSTDIKTGVDTAFVQHGPKTIYIDPPGSNSSSAFLVNDAGTVLGYYQGASETGTFIYQNGVAQPLDAPGNLAFLSDDGTTGGRYPTAGGVFHGYTMKNGVVTTYDYPGASYTSVVGVGPNGTVFGLYQVGNAGNTYESFVHVSGNYYPLFGPGKSPMIITGVSPGKGNLTGFYTDTASHGFFASCPPRHSPCTR